VGVSGVLIDESPPDGLLQGAIGLFEAGHLVEAERQFRTVLASVPPQSAALYGLAMIRLRRGSTAAGEVLLRRVVQTDPTNAGVAVALGNLLTTTGRGEAAAQVLRDVLKIHPVDHALHRNLGNTLRLTHRWQDAERRLRTAIVLQPAYAEAYGNLGDLMVGLGRKKEAIGILNRAVILAPDDMVYWTILCQAKRFAPGDSDLAAMRRLGTTVETRNENAQIHLHFALGKALDDIGAHDEAFTHILAANRLKRRHIPYDEATTLQLIGRIRAIFTPQLLAAKAGQGHPSATPLFVVGMPRSGSTLIAQILASHPDCVSAGETTAMGVALAESSRVIGPFPDGVPGIGAAQLQGVATRYLELLGTTASGKRASRIVDKMPANGYLIGLIHLAFPQAKLIHAVRDPRDTCISAFFQNFEAAQRHNHDLSELGRYWRAYEGLMAHWRDILPEGTILRVSYEDLVDDCDGQTRRLLAHCGLPWDDACLAFHETEQFVLTASAAQVRQPLYRTSVGRWKAYARHLGPLLDALAET
jgi:Flp pilus assembly protein TadD